MVDRGTNDGGADDVVVADASTVRRSGVTLVRATVANGLSTPQRVRVESRLGGPTWPPRREKAVRPEWTDGRWEATIGPGRRRGIGFATPAEPIDEDPVRVVSHRRTTMAEDEGSPAAVLAELGDWCPTSEVLERDP